MRGTITSLTPASGRQDHTTSPCAQHRSSGEVAAPIASRPNVSDDGQRPLLLGQDGGDKPVIWPGRKQKDFRTKDWTGQISLTSLWKFVLFAQCFLACTRRHDPDCTRKGHRLSL